MTVRGAALRVAVDVTPRLLRDALTRVLEDHDVEVVALSSDGPRPEDRLDVVVTSAGGRGRLPAEVHVLDVRPTTSAQAATSAAANRNERIESLDELMSLIRRFAEPA